MQHDKHKDYVVRIISYFDSHLLKGKKIVLDCANGATSYVAPAIFNALGAHTIILNDQPNGTNINNQCGALHPQHLQQAVIEHAADIGFAFDGDGDRVIAVNNRGEIKDGDDLLALLSLHPEYSKYHTVVGTIMANQGLEDYLQSKGKLLLRTKVGDKYIAQEIEAYKLMVGGEQSGHIILNDYLPTGDGIFAALRTCHAISITNNWAMKTFTKYPQILVNLNVSSKKDLSTSPLSDIIEATKTKIGSGRILVRYSGTEPVLRIMAEAQDHKTAQDAVNSLCQQLLHLL